MVVCVCVLHMAAPPSNLCGHFDEWLSSYAVAHTENLKHNWEQQYKERDTKQGKQSRKTRGQALMSKIPFFLQLGKLRHSGGRCFQAAQTCIRGREAQASLTLFGSITRGHIFRWMIWSQNILQCNEYKQAFLLYLSQLCVSVLSLVFNARNSLVRAAESRRQLSSITPLHKWVTRATGLKTYKPKCSAQPGSVARTTASFSMLLHLAARPSKEQA